MSDSQILKYTGSMTLVKQLRYEIDQFIDMTLSAGIKIPAYNEDSWVKFESLNLERQTRIAENFFFYKKVCEQAVGDGHALSDDKTLLWYAIKLLGFRPCSDIFDKIRGEDIIEIYNGEFIQIYRNFNFFDISSYSLLDTFMYEWRELYRRDDDVTAQIADKAVKIFSGDITSTIDPQIKEHELEEIFSPLRYKMNMQERYFSPLFDKTKRVMGILALSSVKVVEIRPVSGIMNSSTKDTGQDLHG